MIDYYKVYFACDIIAPKMKSCIGFRSMCVECDHKISDIQ